MKLSELSTDRALDVLCELTPSIASIMEDSEIISALTDAMPPKADGAEETDGFAAGLRVVCGAGKIAPVLLRTHRADVYNILAALNEKSTAEIAAQRLTDTINQTREVFQDEDLLSFFKSSARQAQTEQSAPSAGSPFSV